MKRHKVGFHFLTILGLSFFLSGCAAVGLTLFGVGAGAATGTSVSYTLDGVAYRTFTLSLTPVESAPRPPRNRMRIKVESTAKTEQVKAISASANDRQIEIE